MIFRVLAWLSNAGLIAFYVVLATCIPAIFIRAIRPISGFILTLSTWLWGSYLWIGCAVLLYSWSTVALAIGILLGGVGVVPLAVIYCLFTGLWKAALMFTVQLCMVWGGRLLASWMMEQA
jgi:hypothetical protein